MLDNKRLTPQIMNALKFMTYSEQVKIFDANCSGCPWATIKVKRNERLTTFKTIQKAIDSIINDTNDYAQIIRGCNYADINATLTEIIMNTCRLWYPETIEGGGNESEIEEVSDARSLREEYLGKTVLEQGAKEAISVQLVS